MIKKIVMSIAAATLFGSAFSTGVFANGNDVTKVAPIHWGSHDYNNADNGFKSGKSFCAKKYIGKKTCIPAMNNTTQALTISTTDYANTNLQSENAVALMGTGSLLTTVFTVQDSKAATVYSGPANNREGVICNEDQTSHNITCVAWK